MPCVLVVVGTNVCVHNHITYELTNPCCNHVSQLAAFARKPEEAGRGGLHLHDLVVQNAMQACNAEALLVGDQREGMFRYTTSQPCMHSHAQTALPQLCNTVRHTYRWLVLTYCGAAGSWSD